MKVVYFRKKGLVILFAVMITLVSFYMTFVLNSMATQKFEPFGVDVISELILFALTSH
jgi:hypothetical protein